MKIWRHLSDDKQRFVYHPTRATAQRELERLSVVSCANVTSRSFYIDQRHLESVEVYTPDSKLSVARLMNKVEAGEQVQWLR